jgi:hypothetical protein
MMEAARTSETSVYNYFTRQYTAEDNSERGYSVVNQTLIFSTLQCHPSVSYNPFHFLLSADVTTPTISLCLFIDLTFPILTRLSDTRSIEDDNASVSQAVFFFLCAYII